MTNLLARSNPVNGADIVANAWQKFEFPSEVTLTTGKTVLVVSRVDA